MSPSITAEAKQPLPARSTVAQRKQANELRKVRKRQNVHVFQCALELLLNQLLQSSEITYFLLFILDSETLVGEEKTCSHQRQSLSFEESDSAPGWQRQCTVLQTGES